MPKCPKCYNTTRQNKAGRTAAGSQRYQCVFWGKFLLPKMFSSSCHNTRIADFFAQALISIPSVSLCRVCLGPVSTQVGGRVSKALLGPLPADGSEGYVPDIQAMLSAYY